MNIKHPIILPAAVGIAVLALAYWIRYGIIEPEVVRILCISEPQAWQCAIKKIVIPLFQSNRLGWAALILGVFSFVTHKRILAWGAWISGILGLVWYCVDFSTVGALLGLIMLAGSQGGECKHPAYP